MLCPSVSAAVGDDKTFTPTVEAAAKKMADQGKVTRYKIWKYVMPPSRSKEDAWFLLEMEIQTKGTLWSLIRYDSQRESFVATEDSNEVQQTREFMSKPEVLPADR